MDFVVRAHVNAVYIANIGSIGMNTVPNIVNSFQKDHVQRERVNYFRFFLDVFGCRYNISKTVGITIHNIPGLNAAITDIGINACKTQRGNISSSGQANQRKKSGAPILRVAGIGAIPATFMYESP